MGQGLSGPTLINLLEDFFAVFTSQKRRPICGKSSPSMRLAAIKVKALTLATSMLPIFSPYFCVLAERALFRVGLPPDIASRRPRPSREYLRG